VVNCKIKKPLSRYPNVFCLQCGSNKNMVYDAVISTKNRHEPDKEVQVYLDTQREKLANIRNIVLDFSSNEPPSKI